MLSSDAIAAALETLPGWRHENRALVKTFAFADFTAGLAFVNIIAPIAESMSHHPDLLLTYSGVTVTLTTHDAGGVTEKDVAMAWRIEEMAER